MNIGFVPQVNQFIEVNDRPARIVYASEKKFIVEYFKTEWRNIPGYIGQIWEVFSETVGQDEFVKSSKYWRHKNRTLKSYGTTFYEYNVPNFSEGIRDCGLIFIKFGELIYDHTGWERRTRGL
jgi:hypothetical protein